MTRRQGTTTAPPRRTLRIAAVTAVLALGVAATGCGGDEQPSAAPGADGAVKIRAAYVPGATFLPAMVAKDTGIFARNKLDVSLTPTQTLSTIPGALGRQFDIGPAVPPVVVKAVGSGIEVVGIAASSVEADGNASELIVRGDSPVRSVAELRGKRLGTADTGAALHASTLNWLQSEGVDPNASPAVEMPFPTMQDQLKAGRVDAVEAIQPFSEIMINAGARSLGAPMLSVARPRVLSTLWIAQREWAERNAAVVKRWRAALVEAQGIIKKDPARARAILQKYTKLPAAVTRRVKLPVYDAEMSTGALAASIVPWQQALGRIGTFKAELSRDRYVAGAS